MKCNKKFYIEGYYQIAGESFEGMDMFEERVYIAKDYWDARNMAMRDGLKKFTFATLIVKGKEK